MTLFGVLARGFTRGIFYFFTAVPQHVLSRTNPILAHIISHWIPLTFRNIAYFSDLFSDQEVSIFGSKIPMIFLGMPIPNILSKIIFVK